MPQITVDYSAELGDAFGRRDFALALHPLVAKTIDTSVPACKTRFRAVEESVVGDEPAGAAIVHITIGMLAGRTPEVKAELTRAVVELLEDHVRPVGGVRVHASAEVRDLDPSYDKN
ncbi:5-carboxymethyl-2-hydroxymuconate Delta-isomerase [uncultured Streptomyces sp.]|uniref:5-carboxymethyl-2-hydroxymuconate Delta-isomerase n=1 Tax=uncultured Streptomyces sp. TaxID=174707 RepID=UPI002637E3AC|nr:isomerase [uncultured Streptomyces sp.]